MLILKKSVRKKILEGATQRCLRKNYILKILRKRLKTE